MYAYFTQGVDNKMHEYFSFLFKYFASVGKDVGIDVVLVVVVLAVEPIRI